MIPRDSGQTKRRTKGRPGTVRIKRGPRKGQTVKALIYPNGSWSEIKRSGRVGARRRARTGKARIKPKYSAASLRARAARKRLGMTFGKSHKANVRRNNVLRRFAPRAAVPHTRRRRVRSTRSPSRHRGGGRR